MVGKEICVVDEQRKKKYAHKINLNIHRNKLLTKLIQITNCMLQTFRNYIKNENLKKVQRTTSIFMQLTYNIAMNY